MRRWFTLALLPLLAGCASPNPDLYTLGMEPGVPQPAGRQIIAVRRVGLPRYLEQREIVRKVGGNRVIVAPNDWWSEPLGAMAQRVLAADLGQRLPGAEVLPGEGPIGADPDAEVQVDLQQFEADGAGQVVLRGFFSINSKGHRGAVSPLRVAVPLAGGSVANLVKAMSAALGQTADGIARAAAIP